MAKKYLTTFEAADLMSVTPDSILKWIKSGKLPALRTPGGHHRIVRSDAEALLKESISSDSSIPDQNKKNFQYCWEFNLQKNDSIEGCEQCVVYRAHAKRCFELSNFPMEYGSLKLFCKSSCDECEYYKLMCNQQ